MQKKNNVPIKNNNGIFVGKDRKEWVEHNATISIGNHRAEDVGQNETISIGSNRSVTISGAVTTVKFRLRCTMFENNKTGYKTQEKTNFLGHTKSMMCL